MMTAFELYKSGNYKLLQDLTMANCHCLIMAKDGDPNVYRLWIQNPGTAAEKVLDDDVRAMSELGKLVPAERERVVEQKDVFPFPVDLVPEPKRGLWGRLFGRILGKKGESFKLSP